jgi:hypothetical protein
MLRTSKTSCSGPIGGVVSAAKDTHIHLGLWLTYGGFDKTKKDLIIIGSRTRAERQKTLRAGYFVWPKSRSRSL